MKTVYHFDNRDRQLGTLPGVVECAVEWELNGERTLELSCLPCQIEKEDRLVLTDTLGRWREFIVVDAEDSTGGGLVQVTGEDSLAELAGDYHVEREPSGNARQLLEACLEHSRWEVGTVDVPGSAKAYWYHESARSGLSKLVELLGGEIDTTIEVEGDHVSRRLVNWRSRLGAARGRRFEYGRDLAEVHRSLGSEKICTRVYGYGAGIPVTNSSGEATGGYSRKITFGSVNGGLDYIDCPADVLERFGRPDGHGGMAHVTGKVEFDDCEDKGELLRLTREWAKAQWEPRCSYTAKVIDLSRAGFDATSVAEGDDVDIVDPTFEPTLRLRGRVIAGRMDLIHPEDDEITLGNVQAGISDTVGDQRDRWRDVVDHRASWDAAASLPHAYLEAVIGRLNEAFNEGGSYHYQSFERGDIWASVPLDAEGRPTRTPATAMQASGKGFRIADEVGPDGDFLWRTFGTGAGFTADEITAGVIRGGSSTWDLNTGLLRMVDGQIEITSPSTETVTRVSPESGFAVSEMGGSRSISFGKYDGEMAIKANKGMAISVGDSSGFGDLVVAGRANVNVYGTGIHFYGPAYFHAGYGDPGAPEGPSVASDD